MAFVVSRSLARRRPASREFPRRAGKSSGARVPRAMGRRAGRARLGKLPHGLEVTSAGRCDDRDSRRHRLDDCEAERIRRAGCKKNARVRQLCAFGAQPTKWTPSTRSDSTHASRPARSEPSPTTRIVHPSSTMRDACQARSAVIVSFSGSRRCSTSTVLLEARQRHGVAEHRSGSPRRAIARSARRRTGSPRSRVRSFGRSTARGCVPPTLPPRGAAKCRVATTGARWSGRAATETASATVMCAWHTSHRPASRSDRRAWNAVAPGNHVTESPSSSGIRSGCPPTTVTSQPCLAVSRAVSQT